MRCYQVIFSDDSIISLGARDSREATLVATAIANEGTRYVVSVREITTNAIVSCSYDTNAEAA